MTYHEARALLPPNRAWSACYGDPEQPGFEEWHGAGGRTYVLRQMAWGEWTAYGICVYTC
jgi:hypothetical protein